MGCSLRGESRGLEIKTFGWCAWVAGDSIYQDEGPRKEENGVELTVVPCHLMKRITWSVQLNPNLQMNSPLLELEIALRKQ